MHFSLRHRTGRRTEIYEHFTRNKVQRGLFIYKELRADSEHEYLSCVSEENELDRIQCTDFPLLSTKSIVHPQKGSQNENLYSIFV